MKGVIAAGHDSVGKFKVRNNKALEPSSYRCPSCRKEPGLIVHWDAKIHLPKRILEAPSFILHSKSHTMVRVVGLTCGCYAKVHRQIAHINGNGRRRKDG